MLHNVNWRSLYFDQNRGDDVIGPLEPVQSPTPGSAKRR